MNRTIIVPPDETMGRIALRREFRRTIEARRAPPLNTADQALALMRIIDATYASARTGRPVKC